MQFDVNYIKSSLNHSLKNSTLMEFDLDSIDGLNSSEVLREYLNLAKSIYSENSLLYIDSDSQKRKLLLFSTILNNIDFDLDLLEKIEINSEFFKDEKFSNEELEKIFEWYKSKDKSTHTLFENIDLIAIVKFLIAVIDNPKLIIIKNPNKLDLSSLILINRLFEVNEFFNSKGFDIGVSFTYLYEKPIIKVEKKRTRTIGFTTPMLHSKTIEEDNSTIVNKQQQNLSSDSPRVYKVYYGTNRKYNDSKYTNELDDKINYGECRVNIPKSHTFGSTGSSWWKRWITFSDDRLKIIASKQKDRDSFFAEINEQIGENDALIYIHGYNTSFEEATIRAGQIGFDLKVPLTAFFSWPSQGEFKDYLVDEDMIQNSEAYIVEFLENFAKNINPEKIHIIAHSMGNRGLLRAFQRMFSLASNNLHIKFGQIFLAAPDVTVNLFKELATLYPTHSKRTTIYVSSKDKALGASEWLHKNPRAGLLPPVTLVNNIDTIEVTDIDITILGHSYFGDAKALLYDIHDLIKSNTNPNQRARLQAIGNYWKFYE